MASRLPPRSGDDELPDDVRRDLELVYRALARLQTDLLAHLVHRSFVPDPPPPALISVEETALRLNLSRAVVTGMVRRGQLAHLKVGRVTWVLRASVIDYVQDRQLLPRPDERRSP